MRALLLLALVTAACGPTGAASATAAAASAVVVASTAATAVTTAAPTPTAAAPSATAATTASAAPTIAPATTAPVIAATATPVSRVTTPPITTDAPPTATPAPATATPAPSPTPAPTATPAANAPRPTVRLVHSAENYIHVEYDRAMKQSGAGAVTSLGAYLLDGQPLPRGSTVICGSPACDIVRIDMPENLAPGSAHIMRIAGVVDAAGSPLSPDPTFSAFRTDISSG